MRAANCPFFDYVVANFGSGVSPRSMLLVGIGKWIYLIAIALCGDGFAKGTHRTSGEAAFEALGRADRRDPEGAGGRGEDGRCLQQHGISSLKKLFADAMLDNAMLKSCCQKKAMPAVKREAGDIKLLTHRGQASRRPPTFSSWLRDACIASARIARRSKHSLPRLSHSFRLIVMIRPRNRRFYCRTGWVFQIQNAC
jgi:hypothetical protein